MSQLKEHIKKVSSEFLPDIIAIRRHLHANPELSFEEHKTSAFIASKLKEYGIPFKTGFVKTGIVATIEGKNSGKKTIALRADMDALPIDEKNDVPYRSKNKGIMHACGHDVHSASLLGVARILQSCKNEFEGTIRLIFQPGEEKIPGGASLMIKEGVLEDPRPLGILAQHVFPSLEAGKVGFRKGMYMASTDELYLTIKGKGGHAAMPDEYKNPIFIAARVLEEVTLRINSEREKRNLPTVVAFGKFEAKGATNVIPVTANIEGTFRTMNEDWRKEAHAIMREVASKVAKENGGEAEFRIEKGYPFLVNDELLTSRAQTAAEIYLGKENVVDLPVRMTAEDFSFYTHVIPGCFYRLGTGNISKGITSGVHTPTFDIDEKALETGMGLMAWIAISELSSQIPK